MPRIELETIIKAEKNIVFDLSRSIDLHKISTKHTKEDAIAGKTNGLIGLNEWVTWRAKHLGFYQELTSKITKFEYPNFFADEMVKGAFKNFKHEHHFYQIEKGTLMTDVFTYQSPYGLLGHLADNLFLKSYMKKLLLKRNTIVKEFAETNKWKEIL